MKLNMLFLIVAVIAFAYGVVAVLAPAFLSALIWPNPPGPEGYLLLQGWGACLIGFAAIAWGHRTVADGKARASVALGLFLYFVLASIVWFIDALGRGWSIFSILTFALLVLFTLGFGYFRFLGRE